MQLTGLDLVAVILAVGAAYAAGNGAGLVVSSSMAVLAFTAAVTSYVLRLGAKTAPKPKQGEKSGAKEEAEKETAGGEDRPGRKEDKANAKDEKKKARRQEAQQRQARRGGARRSYGR